MSDAILVGGLLMVIAGAAAMLRPEWRVPALLFAFLAVPGNVDNLLPQMQLDPHDIPNATAPVASVVDVLIVLALALTYGEHRFRSWPLIARAIVGMSMVTGLLAALVSLIHAMGGLDVGAAIKGVLTIGRVPALLALAFALREFLGDGRKVALAVSLAAIVLLANGLYISAQEEATRFTAATVGRNGLALALMISFFTSVALGIGVLRSNAGRARAWAVGCFGLAAAVLFASLATGTRMALLAAIPAAGLALAINATWRNRIGLAGLAVGILGVVVVGAAATLWTAEGSRAVSSVTDPGTTVDIVTDPEGEPEYSPVRSRTMFWRQAWRMATSSPMVGVGPYQWNHQRYELDETAPPVLADPHNTYLQLAAEFGFPTIVAYVLTLLLTAGIILSGSLRRSSVARYSPTAAAIVVVALMAPVTEMTNSHLFNVRLGPVVWLLLGVAAAIALAPRSDVGAPEAPTASD